MPNFVALRAKAHKIVHIETFRIVLRNWNDVMHFRSSRRDAFRIAVFAKWISNSIVFGKPTPAMIVTSRSSGTALWATFA